MWTGIIAALAFLTIVICGYLFGWKWTRLPKQTLWDWLSLLIVPAVLALGGYLFTRSENQRTLQSTQRQRDLDRELATKQTGTDREIADQRRQDDMLQAYLDGMSQLLTDKDRPLHRAQVDDNLSTLARARTLTALTRLNADRKARVVQVLYEARLIARDRPVLDLSEADLSGASLRGAVLGKVIPSKAVLSGPYVEKAWLRGASLRDAKVEGADGITGEELEAQAKSLKGATMPNGQKYENWLKDKEGGKDRENGNP